MLNGLAGLGVDITGAMGLTGAALDAWIDAAEEASFQREFAEFQEQRRAMHK
jgi:bifunctional DNase/RNase